MVSDRLVTDIISKYYGINCLKSEIFINGHAASTFGKYHADQMIGIEWASSVLLKTMKVLKAMGLSYY